MTSSRTQSCCWLAVVLMPLGGCASSGLSPLSYGVRQVPITDTAPVLGVATDALIELGYEIDRVDQTDGVVTTKPITTTGTYERLPHGARLSSPSRFRRVAQVRVVPGPDVTNVYCRVAVQEQTTEAHRMFQSDQSISDAPGHTAIDRDAATTTEQNTVWETVRRDKAAERLILEEIVRRTESSSD